MSSKIIKIQESPEPLTQTFYHLLMRAMISHLNSLQFEQKRTFNLLHESEESSATKEPNLFKKNLFNFLNLMMFDCFIYLDPFIE